MKDTIAIYHQPQECGSPYLTFLSQQTGEVLETVDLPEGYYDSGSEPVDTLQRIYSFTEKVNMSPRPTVDNVWVKARFMPNPHRYVFKVTSVDNIQKDADIFHTWTADVHVDACRQKRQWKYSSRKDYFRHQMEESGFDMSGWCCYKRRKTPFMDFLKDVVSKYKDYHLVNLIKIG